MNEATRRIHACLLKCDITFLLGFFFSHSSSQLTNDKKKIIRILVKILDWWSRESRNFTFLECDFFTEGLRRQHS